MILFAFGTIVLSYLLGSVNFAVIFTKLLAKKDVRNYGSGNAGSTNALRVGGKLTGTLTFLCDFFKGTLAAFLGKWVFAYIYGVSASAVYLPVYGAYICGIACLLGHIFPFFFKFKGGKGVATGAGIFLGICPVSTVVGLLVFILVFVICKMVSLSSLTAAILLVVTALVMYDASALLLPQIIFALIMLFMVFIKHKDNIVRIINGNENKFAFGGKK